MQNLPKVLVVEDYQPIADALVQVLGKTYYVDVAPTGKQALYKIDIEHYDVIILDLNLPDMTGLDICQQLRERGQQVPILVLTAESEVLTKIKVLDCGANDYLTKPFCLGELKARLRVLTRRRMVMPNREPLEVSGMVLDRQTYNVIREGITINLRRKEFVLLECLMEHAGSVVSRQTLTRYAWPSNDEIWTNTVDVHIKYLRDKIDKPFNKRLIKTVHGLGYKLESTAVEAVKST